MGSVSSLPESRLSSPGRKELHEMLRNYFFIAEILDKQTTKKFYFRVIQNAVIWLIFIGFFFHFLSKYRGLKGLFDMFDLRVCFQF